MVDTMANKMKFVFVILVGLFLLSNLSFAYTIGVNGSNTKCTQIVNASYNWTTIQAAINNATAGDIVIVCRNGSGYKENIIVNKSIILHGNQSGVEVYAASSSAPVFHVNESGVNISNFTVMGRLASYGIELNLSATSSKIYNVTVYNASYGVYVGSSNNYTTILDTTIYNCSRGFYLLNSNTSISNSKAYNNLYGFYIERGVVPTFTGNNVTNATSYAVYLTNLDSNTLTFSGNNAIYRLPSTAYEIYLSNSTISTGIYNITTSNTSFGLNTTSNVTVKSVDLNDLSLTSVNILYSSAGGGDRIYTTVAKLIKNIGVETYYGLNVTNTSATATFAPRLYYNNSDLSGTSSLGVGSSSTSGTWTYYEPTNRDTTLYYLHKTGLTSFSYFAPLAYTLLTQSDTAQGTTTSKSSVTVAYEFACETGEVTVTVASGGSAASGVPVTLVGISPAYSSSGTTNSEGEVIFTIASSGTYKILTDGTSSYYSGSLSNFDLTLCEEEVEEEVEEEQPEEEEEEEIVVEEEEEEEIVVVEEEEEELEVTVTAAEALTTITSAEEEITATEGEQTAALAKLEEAQEAYEEGNYELAKELAEEALTLIEEPEAPPAGPTAPEAEEEEQVADYSWVMYLLGVIVLAVVLIAGYFLLRGSKKGYK